MLRDFFKKYLPRHWQGVVFDLVFAALNLTLLPIFGMRLASLFDASFREDATAFLFIALLVVLVYLWRLAALYLKRGSFRSETEDVPLYIWILSLASSLLGGAFLLVLILSFLADAGIADVSGADTAVGLSGLALPLIELWLIYRLFRAPADERAETDGRNQRGYAGRDLFADLGLFAHIFLWQAFYNAFMSAVISVNVLRSPAVLVFALCVSAVAFVMFYVGPRSVYMLGAGGSRFARLTIALVFLSSFTAHLIYSVLGV